MPSFRSGGSIQRILVIAMTTVKYKRQGLYVTVTGTMLHLGAAVAQEADPSVNP